MDTFANAYDEKIRPLMDKIDQARSFLSSSIDGLILPNVVVVGDQSSGKSTLLEALSLVELPKGSGIVTRCPLVLRLRKFNERRVYRIYPNNRKVQLDEENLNILTYIEEETKKLAGDHKNVVHDMIELLVEDPSVRDLTLVDLPGIARNPIADQPKDIQKQTINLIHHYIRQEGSVILCVFPANVDVATVESFTLAREVDPSGIRTIGVVTKSDLATDPERLAQQLLMEKPDVLHLKLGFVAVRNRSTDERISLEAARKREKQFFREHSTLTVAGWHCLGIDALINRLADLYSDRVKETFPKMRNEIQTRLKDVREQLSKLPPSLETTSSRLAKYYELSDFYVENILKIHFLGSIDGHHVSMANTLHIKLKKFEEIINTQSRELLSEKYRSRVKNAMAASFGEQLPNFLPHPILKRLICEKIDQLWQVTDMLIKECFHVTSSMLLENDTNACNGDILLLKLLRVFHNVVGLYLDEKKQIVHDQLKELIRLEKQEPYTINHYYMDTINRFKERVAEHKPENANKKKPSPTTTTIDENDDESMFNAISNDDRAVQDMLISIYSYWKLLTKRFIDYTALALRAGCDYDVCPGIRERLRRVPVEQSDFVDAYLAEDAIVRSRRQQLQQARERLEKVDAILGGGAVTTVDGNDTFTNLTSTENHSSMTLDRLAENLSHTGIDDNSAGSIRPKSSFMEAATRIAGKTVSVDFPPVYAGETVNKRN